MKYFENAMNIHEYLYLWITIFKHVLTIAYPVFWMQKKKDKDEYSVLPFSLPLSNRENKKYLEKCIKAIAMNNYI